MYYYFFTDVCVLQKEAGSCHGSFPRWYYDFKTGICEHFIFTGCQGNRNRFLTKVECENQCNSTWALRGRMFIYKIQNILSKITKQSQ